MEEPMEEVEDIVTEEFPEEVEEIVPEPPPLKRGSKLKEKSRARDVAKVSACMHTSTAINARRALLMNLWKRRSPNELTRQNWPRP